MSTVISLKFLAFIQTKNVIKVKNVIEVVIPMYIVTVFWMLNCFTSDNFEAFYF